ncbi:MAG: hypothetical protein CMB73_07280 [Euryarchaeota archaeon]|nr:hypothetical protein [Euryarchaeota archaeon]
MYMSKWFNDPEINTLLDKYKNKFPGVRYEEHMKSLGQMGWYGLDLNKSEVIEVFEKCLKENKIFQVWNLSYKGKKEDGPPTVDWWEGKLVFKKFSPSNIS